jgi:hypothetical protein
MMTTTTMFRSLSLLALPLVLAACGKTDSAAPAIEDPTASADAGATTPSKGEVVRTIEERSPFGNLSIADNLVLDGDFEFTGRNGQMPWLVFSNSGQGTLAFATGGLCRSGVRCAALPAGSDMIGWMASPKSGGMNVSVWAKPPSGKCEDLRVLITDIEGAADGDTIPPETSPVAPGAWCHYVGDAGNFANTQPAVYVTTANARVQGPILVDDAVIRALPATLKKRVVADTRKLDEVAATRVRFIGDWVRTHRIFGLPSRASIEGPDSKLIDAPRRTMR